MFAIKLIFIFFLVHFFYSFGIKKIGDLTRYVDILKSLAISKFEKEKIARLFFASGSQFLFMLLLIGITGCIPNIIDNLKNLTGWLVLQGVLLGVAEMSVSGLFAKLVMNLVVALSSKNSTENEENLIDQGKGGWILEYRKLVKYTPFYIYIPVILCYVGTEELIFRCIFIDFISTWGVIYAFVFSTVWFTIVQVYWMPSLRAALFPASGAFLMGCIHGYLYISQHNVIPLVIAHLVFFFLSILPELLNKKI